MCQLSVITVIHTKNRINQMFAQMFAVGLSGFSNSGWRSVSAEFPGIVPVVLARLVDLRLLTSQWQKAPIHVFRGIAWLYQTRLCDLLQHGNARACRFARFGVCHGHIKGTLAQRFWQLK